MALRILALAAAAAADWAAPKQYSVSVLLELPYIDLVEPIEVYYDEAQELQRMDYWHGADTYVFNATAGENSTSHQIVPTSKDGATSAATCFSMTGEAPLASVFPSLAKFTKADGTKQIRGVEVDAFELVQPEFDPASGMIGNYSFYVRHDDGATPVSFEFLGHNTITGGHVDEWAFVYSAYAPGPQKAELFTVPWAKMTCAELETDDDDGPTGNNACDGGLDSNAYDWMLEVNGGKVAAAEPYGGYKNADGACHAADGFHAKITGYVNVTGLPAFNDALANVGPLSISIDATPEDFYYYKSGFYYSDDCKGGVDDLDHTVLAVGVKVHGDQRYTIVKNSWSTHWGDGGYVCISQKNNCCGVATAATYPLIA
ncbi:transferase [Aureococcus anophagefferens]|nr:transferase [Aureococcus anophagefferens]